ncbi:MAG: proton-conducting transporter membrane subunit [Clostridia bacterium]|nr:proton-conducting transporter membrane subunit [Clostridia bacterium]MDD4047795.1 proton-conducting transporter membrane subunit [Clostridia bacterium]
MEVGLATNLFKAAILFYLLGAAVALILINRHKLCNIISNAIYSVASALLIVSSIIKIISGSGQINISLFESPIPFITMNIRIDNLSAIFLLALSLLVLCVSLYSMGYISHYYGKRNVGIFNFLYSTFILSMIFVFTSANVVFFYIAWELMSMLSYFLVIFESEHEGNQRAGIIYIIMTYVGTAFLLIGFMLIYSYTNSFDIFGSSAAIPEFAKNIIFIMFLIGFATKAGAIPFHVWLPQAHPAAPSNVSALMSGIMIKTAIYGFVRFVLCYLGIQNTWWGVLILCIGIVSAVLGVAYALMEHNIKRLLAYSSVENIGIILIGLGVCFIAFAQENLLLGEMALVAALFHTFNHTLFKGGLFLGAGAIQYSTHTKDMEKLGGLIKTMPITALFILCFSLAVSAIVPFNGFVSEWLTYQSLFANIVSGQAGLNILSILAVAALGFAGAMAAACFVKLFGISFLGLPRSDHSLNAKEVPITMKIGMGMLATLCFAIGLFPLLILKLIDKVVFSLMGSSILEQLHGGCGIAYYSLNLSSGSISPAVMLIAIAGVILLALLGIRIIGGKYIERKYGTWDCGFEALNSRMQYTATGFSKPIKIVFKILFRPSRETVVTGDLAYHPESIEYITADESIIEKYIYNPVCERIKYFSRRMTFGVQTGSIHSYLTYIFVTVLLLMLYNMIA